MDYSSPGSSLHGISQAKMLEWGATSCSRGSSRPRQGLNLYLLCPLHRQADSLPLAPAGAVSLRRYAWDVGNQALLFRVIWVWESSLICEVLLHVSKYSVSVWAFIMLSKFHICSFLFKIPCYGDQEPIISGSERQWYLPTPLFSRQKRNGRKMFILKIIGLLVLKSQSLALRSSAFSALYFKHFRCSGFRIILWVFYSVKTADIKVHLVVGAVLEGRRLFLLYHDFVNFVAFCHVSREKLCDVEYARSIQVRRVHSLLPTEAKTFCFGNQCKVLFWCEASCHFPQDSQAAAETGRSLTKNTTEKSIHLWHKQCSASVLGKCGPDVLPCLKQILLLFTFSFQL